jgi:hypothetical protein
MKCRGVFCEIDRHSCEACVGLDPVAGIQKGFSRSTWMPAFAGMTRKTPRLLN